MAAIVLTFVKLSKDSYVASLPKNTGILQVETDKDSKFAVTCNLPGFSPRSLPEERGESYVGRNYLRLVDYPNDCELRVWTTVNPIRAAFLPIIEDE